MIARIEFDYRAEFEKLAQNPASLAVMQASIAGAPTGEEALKGVQLAARDAHRHRDGRPAPDVDRSALHGEKL